MKDKGLIASEVKQVALLFAWLLVCLFLTTALAHAQTINPDLRPDMQRALAARTESSSNRPNDEQRYTLAQTPRIARTREETSARRSDSTPRAATALNVAATNVIQPGTPLTQVLHTSQLSLFSAAGTNEQFVDRNGNLVADERTTFDSAGGSFDIAVGRSGVRYEVYSATPDGRLVGVLVMALDTNGDYRLDSSTTFDLRDAFGLRSAAAVVTGTSKAGREFVIVSSSGYFNSANPNDPRNEPSPGVILLFRDPSTGGFDDSRTRELVRVGDDRLYTPTRSRYYQ